MQMSATHNTEASVEGLVAFLEKELANRERKVQAIATTLTSMEREPGLFDDVDLQVVRASLNDHTTAYGQLQKNLSNAKTLYEKTLLPLERKIEARRASLSKLDLATGVLSSESTIQQHFAKHQADLEVLLTRLKTLLCEAICERVIATPPA